MSIPRNLGNFADNVDTNGQVSLTTGVTGTLPVANGGSGSTTSTGSGANVLATSPTLVTPALGTPASGVLTNATGLPLTTGVTGTLPVANGGTGAATLTANNVLLGNGTSALQVVAPGANGNILTSNGTTWTSSTPAGGGVTSLNGQTGAVVDTTINNIGCMVHCANTSTSNLAAGSTIAGSSLYYPTTFSGQGTSGQCLSEGATTSSLPRTQWDSGGSTIMGGANRRNSGNTGYVVPQGCTAGTGTYRILSIVQGRRSSFDPCSSATSSDSYCCIAVRIS